ncbi:murein L,D-transpeptidase catalytic domain family protein [Sphingomicrobium nitratireducens]|uniref:murein L,D-transpeptidase catalytic domain family protein n=1 Tax=Sphingomicrobium nitratireducens TaxID=2964666 RepID=UPI00223FEAF4|nr:murein L,D-transpeptidase catalytic domain family protein [Sphingomicrobium nitratireducens]
MAAGAGGVMVAGPAMAQADPFQFRQTPQGSMVAPGGAPLVRSPSGVDSRLVERARAALDRHASRVRHRDAVGIVDFSKRSDTPRFHLVNMTTGQVESFLTTHGRGSDRGHTGYLQDFSNRVGSNATSQGAYVTASQYHGKYGLSMKLQGLDFTNSNAFARAIVMHPAWYAEKDMIAKHGKLGRSEGCFAFGSRDHWLLMNRLGDGRLIYADKLA